jgi:hypothetical protein
MPIQLLYRQILIDYVRLDRRHYDLSVSVYQPAIYWDRIRTSDASCVRLAQDVRMPNNAPASIATLKSAAFPEAEATGVSLAPSVEMVIARVLAGPEANITSGVVEITYVVTLEAPSGSVTGPAAVIE